MGIISKKKIKNHIFLLFFSFWNKSKTNNNENDVDHSTEPRADKKEMSKVIWATREELDHMNLYPPFRQFLELEKEWINNEKR